MSWIGWAIIGLFVFVAALMGYMVWIIWNEYGRRGGR